MNLSVLRICSLKFRCGLLRFSWNFQGCITVQLSRINVLLFFSDNSVILSHRFLSVNNFFKLFSPAKSCFARWNFILPHRLTTCQQFFTIIFRCLYNVNITSFFALLLLRKAQKKKSQSLKILFLLLVVKRRKRDLNPRAA